MSRLLLSGAVLLAGCAGVLEAPSPTPAESEVGAVVVAGDGMPADLAKTEAFLDTRPIYERPLDDGMTPVQGVGSLSAAACGACHVEIYEEWKLSTHANAWGDRQFQEEIKKSGNRWLCLNCHTPLLVQQDRWPRDLVGGDVERPVLVDNPVFDAALRDEGITCAACHVVDGVVHGPGIGGEAPHPVVEDAAFRDPSAVCERCHQAVAIYPGKTFVCTFRTGEEWRAGPWDDEGIGCVQCHMPPVNRPAAVGAPARPTRRHGWRGAGIPKVAGVQPPAELYPPGLELDAAVAGDALVVTMTNARAGHMLPTGDPERWVQVDVQFVDADGAAVGEPWQERIGQRWVWDPVPQKVGDTRLAPREPRVRHLPIPAGAARAVLGASSHRMSEETADWHELTGRYPLSVDTHHLEVDLAGALPRPAP